MTCTRFAALVHELVDGRLEPALADELHRHASDCAACAELLRTDQWLVDAVGRLDDPPTPAPRLLASIARSIDGLAALERREQIFPAVALPAQPSWLRWPARAALVLLALSTGLVLGRRTPAPSPRATPARPVAKQQPPEASAPLPNTWRPVAEQAGLLARHLDSTAGLYRQATNLNISREELARPILAYELNRSGLKAGTPELRRLLREPRLARGAAHYLAASEKLVQTLEGWVQARDRSLATVQIELRQADLPHQIAALRKQVTVLLPQVVTTAAGVGSDPGVQIYLKAREFYHRGQPGRMLVLLKSLEQQFPQHALRGNVHYWLKSAGEEFQIERATAAFPQVRMVVAAGVAGHLAVDGARHPLRDARGPALAFYALWGAVQHKRLARQALIYTIQEERHARRQITLSFKQQAAQDHALLTLYRTLQQRCGIHPATGFPSRLELQARESDCPSYLKPEEKE